MEKEDLEKDKCFRVKSPNQEISLGAFYLFICLPFKTEMIQFLLNYHSFIFSVNIFTRKSLVSSNSLAIWSNAHILLNIFNDLTLLSSVTSETLCCKVHPEILRHQPYWLQRKLFIFRNSWVQSQYFVSKSPTNREYMYYGRGRDRQL